MLNEPNCAEAKVDTAVIINAVETFPICLNSLYKRISVMAAIKALIRCALKYEYVLQMGSNLRGHVESNAVRLELRVVVDEVATCCAVSR